MTSARQAIDLVEAGKDISWSDGNATHIMHIAKRDGASLEGIRVVDKSDGGLVTTITADKGTLQSHFQTTVSSGVEYTNAVMITLYDAQVQSATTNQTVKEYGVVFHQ